VKEQDHIQDGNKASSKSTRGIFSITLVIVGLSFAGAVCAAKTGTSSSKGLQHYLTDLPFSMPEMREPEFPERTVNIHEYGAVPDGHTLNTIAFANAITACSKAGGGTVIVPPGTWVTGPIRLESNINLHVERGALVQFSRHIDDFPLIAGFDGKSKRYIVVPPIYAYKASNIAITGDGIFDGAGEVWRYVKKEKLTDSQWKDLTASGGVVTPDGKEWWPSRAAMDGDKYLRDIESSGKTLTARDFAEAREFLRPDLVHLVQCRGILLDGPTFENSPRYHVHPVQCEDVIIRNVEVLTQWYAQNGDGIDLSSCRNVVIYSCTLDVGDDGICLKPGINAGDQSAGPSCQNIVIADCVVYHAHGGFVIGSESQGGARNVSVRNCVFVGTDVGLRFKSARDRGGLIEKIFIDGIQMREIATDAILFDMYYAGGAPDVEAKKDLSDRKAEPLTDRTPQFQDFSIKNVVCTGANWAMLINGLPEMPVKNIVLAGLSVAAKRGVILADAEGITLDSCSIAVKSGPVISVIDGRDITVDGGVFPPGADVFLKVAGEKSENIQLVGIDLTKVKKEVELGENVKPDAVVRK
jgi:DNA sulfur modification protein DndE